MVNSLSCHEASYKLVFIGSGNSLLPVLCQAITWTNPDLLSIGILATSVREIWIKNGDFHSRNKRWFSSKKMHLIMLSAKCWMTLFRRHCVNAQSVLAVSGTLDDYEEATERCEAQMKRVEERRAKVIWQGQMLWPSIHSSGALFTDMD